MSEMKQVKEVEKITHQVEDISTRRGWVIVIRVSSKIERG
jgi:hypothetical protein